MSTWEELRKDARRCESAIERELGELARLGTTPTTNDDLMLERLNARSNGTTDGSRARSTTTARTNDGMTVGYGGGGSTSRSDALGNAFEACGRVETEIDRLRGINEEMARTLKMDEERAMSASATTTTTNGGGGEYRDARTHTLQRHREVLSEYAGELRRLRRDVEEEAGRDALLGGASRRGGGGGGDDESMEARLIRERARIAGSTSAVDDLIGVAQNTARELFAQRGILSNAGNKLIAIGSKFPAVNNLLLAIKRKKNKDAVILAAVVAACTIFVLLYYMSK